MREKEERRRGRREEGSVERRIVSDKRQKWNWDYSEKLEGAVQQVRYVVVGRDCQTSNKLSLVQEPWPQLPLILFFCGARPTRTRTKNVGQCPIEP